MRPRRGGGAQVRPEMKARAGEGDGDVIGEKQERREARECDQ